ncbi:MAG: hypothetical protein HZB37_03455, partial [Planctomycetes bacterium]|nr:hypothetical protein [Planctomycetota bacterium]
MTCVIRCLIGFSVTLLFFAVGLTAFAGEKKESGDTPVAEVATGTIVAEDKAKKPDVKKESSYTSVVEGPFDSMMAQDKANKPDVMKRHLRFLNERYDLSLKTTTDVTMSGGKPLPV